MLQSDSLTSHVPGSDLASADRCMLAIDTAEGLSSVALQLEGKPLVSKSADRPNAHAQVCLSAIDELLDENHVALNDIDYYVYAHGPGSYTGLRVGAGVLQGLLLVHPKPVIHVASAAAYAHSIFLQHDDLSQLRIVRSAYGGACYYEEYANDDGRLIRKQGPVMTELDELPDDDLQTYFIPPLAASSSDTAHLFVSNDVDTQAARIVRLACLALSGQYDAEIHDSVHPLYLKQASDWRS